MMALILNKRGLYDRGNEDHSGEKDICAEPHLVLLFLSLSGTTLRTFLSKLLNCDPMRISKKFVGSNCIGKQVFRRRQVKQKSFRPTIQRKND